MKDRGLIHALTHKTAVLFLSLALISGASLQARDSDSLKTIRQKAEQGNTWAQYKLGSLYAHGANGLPKDYVQAALWCRKSAEQGYTTAQYNLGISYAVGLGVPKDPVLAYAWFNIAAASGHARARKFRDDFHKILSPEDLSKATDEARTLFAQIQARSQK